MLYPLIAYGLFVTQETGIDPEAKALYERMTAKYRGLKTLQCTVINGAREGQRSRFFYQQPGQALIQRLYAAKPGVEAEYRVVGQKLVVSATENRKRYLRSVFDPAQPLSKPLQMLENQAQSGIDGLGMLIEDWNHPRLKERVTEMRLGERATAADGTPVQTLVLGTQIQWANGSQTVNQNEVRTYWVGVNDHLVRKIVRKQTFAPDRTYERTSEFENIVANGLIDPKLFAFTPAKGMVAVAPVLYRSGDDPKVMALTQEIAKAMAALNSLSFTSEWKNESITWDASGKVSPTRDRVTVRYDLQRPLLARGEFVMGEEYGHQNMLVVSDGKAIYSRQGAEKDFVQLPLRTKPEDADAIATYGRRGIPLGAGYAAAWLTRAFYGAQEARFALGFFNYRVGTPRKIGNETFDVLESSNEPTDEYGIPTGLRSTERFYFGQSDRLLHRVEREHPTERFGKVYVLRTTETFPRMEPDSAINPALFAFDAGTGRAFGDADAVEAAAGRTRVRAAVAGDTPSSLPTKTLDGKTFSLADLKGQVVIVDAYTYGCRPCRQHMLDHRGLVEKYAARGLTTVGLILDPESDRAIVEKFVREQRLTYPQLFDGQGWNGPAARQFGIASVPFTVIIGRDGKVSYVDPADRDLERILIEELKKLAVSG
ncbi:MAG: peroxiredoxin family protein [Fimbriimonas sp.]